MKEGNKIIYYKQSVEIKKKFGEYFGYIVPSDENYSAIKDIAFKRPLRVKGETADNRYFTGYWYHPIEAYRYHGSFQLLIEANSEVMIGIWTGYSETKNKIDYGQWNWRKIKNIAKH